VPRCERLEGRSLPRTFTVLNFADSGPGSLRQASRGANVKPGAYVTQFDRQLKGTITLTSGQLTITSDVTVNGPGADKLTVSGNDTSRIFTVAGGRDESARTTVSILGLTLSQGSALFNARAVLNGFFSSLTR
jgi:hypothetical protein